MNLLLYEAIMNYRYRRRLIVTHVRKLKRVHKLGQYFEVHKYVCVFLKYFADIWLGMFLVQIDRHKWNILGNENSTMYSKWGSCRFQ